MSNTYEEQLINAYINHGIVVDTNLLILDFVGHYNLSKIETFKRTKTYTTNDYLLLQKILSLFSKVIINQPILTESFNLIDSLNSGEDYALNQHLITRITQLRELAYSKEEILGMASFAKFGFADASIDHLSSYYLILTDDLRLYGYLSSRGKPAINFNHLRVL